jgi:hypothetical protein
MKSFKFVMTAGVLVASFSAMAAFTGGMGAAQIDTEVQRSLGAGLALDAIASSAKASGVSGGLLTSSLIGQKQDTCKVISSLVGSGFSANEVVNAAKASGAKYDAAVGCAIAAGADPTTITEATAAGAPGDAGGAGVVGGNNGFSGGGGSTFSGGGGSGGSRS